jgi:membrane associated rhomboid family serine protease
MFPPVIKWLIAINILLFLLGLLPYQGDYQGAVIGDLFVRYGALWPTGSAYYMPWQYFTYMFLHGGFSHIFFNLFVLWMFGMELEQMWGSKRFLAFYLLCGLGAGAIHTAVTYFVGNGGPTIGASGAIMGVMIAFGMNFPDRIIFLGLFFPLKAKYAILLIVGIDLVSGVTSSSGVLEGGRSDGIAHFAHLGGALIGFILLQAGGKLTLGRIFDRFAWFGDGSPRHTHVAQSVTPEFSQRERSNVIDVGFRDVETTRRSSSSAAPLKMNFGDDQERIDGILDKISRYGYQNLTDEEKAILNEASKKL